MIKKLLNHYRNSSLASKIRYSYAAILIPMVSAVIISIIALYIGNHKYMDLIKSAAVAGEFSLDFKEEFDYETYLVVVENKTLEESKLDSMLDDANRIVNELYAITTESENKNRLNSAKKYLENLQKYINNIDNNLQTGFRYEENIVIWENDVQIVTALISETLNEYVFYEIRDLQIEIDKLEKGSILFISIFMIATVIFVTITVSLSYQIAGTITKPISELSEMTKQVSQGDFSVRSHIEYGDDETKQLGDSLNSMVDKIEELLDQVTVEQIRLRHAELELLQAQINPHFLYNTLDTIVWLAEAGEQEKVIKMVGSLSKFFRTSLNQGKDNISIGEELQHARSYLEIQQVRYQDILNYSIDVPDELFAYLIPKITIQPLIENALYHGIKNKRGLGTIKVYGKTGEACIYLYVEDDGIGMSEERLTMIRNRIDNPDLDSEEIFGLHNVNERIRLRFGDEYGITVESQYGKGTCVTVKLPCSINSSGET